ncbi:MAG: glycoside hydrolase family 5 protein [Fibromonadales bacterium]|nr:glycoside hydrolase family 5 protein [Fibromonadales bacterium]
MKSLLLLVLSVFFFFACNSSSNGPNSSNSCVGEGCEDPGEEPGSSSSNKLSVNGRDIIRNGEKLVLRGMSLYWYQGPWGGGQFGNRFYTEETVRALADNWGANLVRAAIGNVYQNTSDALSVAKNMMDWANNVGIYVIIDNHSHEAHRTAHAAAAHSFFREVSAYVKEKGYTHVIYEIYNEPVCDWDQVNKTACGSTPITSWAIIKEFSEGVINTIRSNDPDGIILVGTPYFSSRIHQVLPNRNLGGPILGQNNIMYVFHYYASESSHMDYQERFKEFYCENFPLFITEWGTTPSSGNGAINMDNNNSWMSLIEGAGISWANWSLSNANESSAALTSVDVNGSTRESGTIVKNWIKELNAGRSVEGVNPVQISCN